MWNALDPRTQPTWPVPCCMPKSHAHPTHLVGPLVAEDGDEQHAVEACAQGPRHDQRTNQGLPPVGLSGERGDAAQVPRKAARTGRERHAGRGSGVESLRGAEHGDAELQANESISHHQEALEATGP